MNLSLTCFRAFTMLLAVLFIPSVDVPAAAVTEETAVVKGGITDVEGGAVQGAMVFAYTSPDVRRSADFISAPADKDGLFRLVMPPGKYWLVARYKKTGEFGPLMPGDKHSGDPGEIELAAGSTIDMDFIVADLKEAIRMKRETIERPVKLGGRVLDEKGAPVPGSYVIAYRNKEISRIPDYLSAWVGPEGHYTLYIPAGTYTIGAALTFPPEHNYTIHGDMVIESDRSDLDIIVKTKND